MRDLLMWALGSSVVLGVFDLIALKWGVESAAWDRDNNRRVAL